MEDRSKVVVLHIMARIPDRFGPLRPENRHHAGLQTRHSVHPLDHPGPIQEARFPRSQRRGVIMSRSDHPGLPQGRFSLENAPIRDPEVVDFRQ